jgi:hypothetical protein
MVTLTLTLTNKELELLSQALGEAVARAESNVVTVVTAQRIGVKMTFSGHSTASLQAKHQALLHLMRKVDGGPD